MQTSQIEQIALEGVEVQQSNLLEGDTSLEVMSQAEQGAQEVKGLSESPQGAQMSPSVQGIFSERSSFEHALRVAQMLSRSDMVPQSYRGNVQNVMVALEISQRSGVSPLMVMQNLHMIQGKPSWSSTFIIAGLNSSKRFSPLEFELSGEGDDYGCRATALERSTGKRLEGSRVTLSMAKAEGWYGKSGSKWKSMPEQMLKYRAASFFCRIYAPELLMGMYTSDETRDMNSTSRTDIQSRKQAAMSVQEAYKSL